MLIIDIVCGHLYYRRDVALLSCTLFFFAMKKPANPGGKNRSRLARGFRKIVSIFSSKSEFNTNTSFSTAKAGGTKVVKGSEIRPAKTDTVLETFSHSDNASTGLKENSSTAVDPSITTPSNPIGPFHDTAAITSGPGSDMPGSSFSVINCTPDTTELANAVGNAPSANNPQSTRSELSAAPTTLPFDNASPAVTAIPTGAAVPAFDTIPGSDKSILNADGTLIIPQIAVAETANGPVTAPGVNPASINERTAQPQLWLQAKHAPIWNEALQILKEEESGMYKELEKTKSSLLDSRERKTDEFFKLDTAKPEEKAIVQRWKQYLPSLAAIRGIAMRAAVFEPHGVAPIVCACVFFSIDVRALSVYQNFANQFSFFSTPCHQRQRVRCETSYSRVSLLSTNGYHSNPISKKKVTTRFSIRSKN